MARKIFINLGSSTDKDLDGYENFKFDPQYGTKAAWVKDGTVALGGSGDATNIFEKGKRVKCFDFPKWLEQFKEEDEVILKMDIEGAEYEILKKMIANHTTRLIDKLYIEWHAFCFPQFAAIEEELKNTVQWKDWHGEEADWIRLVL